MGKIIYMSVQGFLIMGVSGSGKSTVGRAIADRLGWDFFDADDFHTPENIAKMENGIPLDDADRFPWLVLLNHRLLSTLKKGRHSVLACSALREMYRIQLLKGVEGVAVVYLKGGYDMIWSRISSRKGHFMNPNLLKSQFDILEEPQDAFIVDVSLAAEEIVNSVLGRDFPGKELA